MSFYNLNLRTAKVLVTTLLFTISLCTVSNYTNFFDENSLIYAQKILIAKAIIIVMTGNADIILFYLSDQMKFLD